MKQFLGWDCANKSLAWSHLRIDTHVYSKMRILAADLAHYMEKSKVGDANYFAGVLGIIGAMNFFLDNFLTYISSGVVDILPGRKVKDTTEIERTRALWMFLKGPVLKVSAGERDLNDTFEPFKVIIEHQPAKIGTKANTKSTAVAYQLAYHYIEHDPIMIDPKLKNTVNLIISYDDMLKTELPRHKSPKDARYTARKKHSKVNFLHLLKVFGLMHITVGIAAANLDDLADSTMQILAYLVRGGYFAT